MTSQTARRPQSPRPPRPTNKPKKYIKQTARFEGKRDGKPLIFGWGTHLSHNEKVQIQQRATWITAISLILLIIVVLVGFWINLNIITPGLPITSVNGHQIPQSLYRKMVAFKAELAQNALYGPQGLTAQRDSLRKQIALEQQSIDSTTKQITEVNKELKALKPGSSPERTNLNTRLKALQAQLKIEQDTSGNLNQQSQNIIQNEIPQQQSNYNQSQIGNDSVTWLQDDEVIREWLSRQPVSIQVRINPSASVVNHAMDDFRANVPTSTTYNGFLSKDGVSDSDMQAMMTIKFRRDNMQAYLASLVVSPTYQVLARVMTIDTKANADKILNQLKHGGDFGKIAKQKSADANTNSKGGVLDWLPRGEYVQLYTGAVVENWMFDPARKLNELSPVLVENGAYHIAQILGIDPSRPVPADLLKSLKDNALSNWIQEQHALPTTKIAPVDQDKLLDPANMPPDLPVGAPSNNPSGVPGGGVPGGVPGGIPGGGVPGGSQP